MTGTVRISRYESSPSTTFYLTADQIAQSIAGNYSVVRCYLSAYCGPGGSTGSFFNNAGYQAGSIDGVGEFGRRSSNPFLPSGYPNGALRWEIGAYDVVVPHNVDGTKTAVLRMILSYGSHQQNLTANLPLTTIPRIPYAFLRWNGAAEVHAATAVRWDGTKEVALTTAVRWNGTSEESLL